MSKYGFEMGQGMYTGTKFESLTITTAAATGFSAAVYPLTIMRALVTVETSSIRYRYDGVAPTVGTGHLLGSGDVMAIIGLTNIQNFQSIAVTTNAVLMVTYEVDKR